VCVCVCVSVRARVGVPGHMVDNGSKVGGPVQLNGLKALVVSFQNSLHAVAVGVLNVAILKGIVKSNSSRLML